jgi:general secretion pathway protein G
MSTPISRLRKRKGFTLIELLVVILILAILAALIVPRVVGRASDAKRAKAASDIATLSQLLQQYRLDNDKLPTAEQGLNALVANPGDTQNWRGPYISKSLPTDPWGNEYIYDVDGENFLITSYGADGAPGGDGDNSDITNE